MKKKQHVISKADFARRVGRAKSTMTEHFRGALSAALVGRRIDVNHPTVSAWASVRGIDVADLKRDSITATARRESNEAAAVASTEYFVPLREVSRLAGVEPPSPDTADLCVDLGSAWVLEIMAAHPFARDSAGNVIEELVPEGFLAPACVGDDIDPRHPAALAFRARRFGALPSATGKFAGSQPVQTLSPTLSPTER